MKELGIKVQIKALGERRGSREWTSGQSYRETSSDHNLSRENSAGEQTLEKV